MPLLSGTTTHDTLDASAGTEPYEIHGLAGSDVIRGSAYGDLIVGGPGADQMFGNGGDDTFLVGADTMADLVNGGDGMDTILGTAASEVLLFSSIVSIERIDGGGGVDILRGSEGGTFWNLSGTTLIGIWEIDGAGSNDDIVGSAGDDRIRGGAGNDTLDGGPGVDTALFSGRYADYTLTALSGGRLQVATSVNPDGSDTLRNFERLEFSDGRYANGVFTPSNDPLNTPPDAAADAYAAVEDETRTVTAAAGVLANDGDRDGDALTVASFDAKSAKGGTVALNADGSFSYTPAANFNGADQFSYLASDGRGGTAAATVTMTVSAVNDAPVAGGDQYAATRDTALVIAAASGVLANDSDPDGDGLTVSAFDATSREGGTVALNADGSFTYTPPAGYTGTDRYAYTASDGKSEATATVDLVVNPPGSALPVLVGTTSHDTLDVSTAATAYEIRGLSGSDVIRGSAFGDLIVGGPGADQMFGNDGDDTFLAGSDGVADLVNGGAGMDAILGTPADDVLLFSTITSVERIDGGGGLDVLRGTDGGTFWNFSNTTLVGIAEIDGRGSNDDIVGSAGNDRIRGGAGNDTLDGGAGSDTAVFSGSYAEYTITALAGGALRVSTAANTDGTDTLRNFELLEFADGTYAGGQFDGSGVPGNTTPVAAPDAYAATEDQPLVVSAANGVLANDTDADGDALAIASFSAKSAKGGIVAMAADGSYTYTPAAHFNGSDQFSYTAADGHGGTATATVTMTVAAVADAPVAADNAYAATRDTALLVNAAAGVLANDTDPDGDALTVSAFDAKSAQGGTVTMAADGSFTYTPLAGYTGADRFSYTASDGALQDVATVNITVNAPGSGLTLVVGTTGHDRIDRSTAATPHEIRGLAGSDVIYGTPYGDLLVGGPGADQMFGNAGDDTFTVTADTVADLVNGGDGFDTILGTAADETLIFSSITSVERIDGGGGADILRGTDGGNFWNFTRTTLVGIVEIDGRGSNDDIVGSIADDRIRGGAGNDTLDGWTGVDTALYSGNYADYVVSAIAGGLRVSTTVNTDGTDTLRNFETLEFSDGTYAGGVFTPFAHPTNTTPRAVADAYAVAEDQVLTVGGAGVLANDTDADGDALAVAAFDAVSVKGGAVAMAEDGSFNYTPVANFNGSDSFSYTAADGRGGTAIATVTVNVSAVSDMPVVTNNRYVATRDAPLAVNAAAGVLANDHDADGDTLTVSAFDARTLQGGTVAMSADGSFIYTPPAGYLGDDSYAYTASDGVGTGTAVVELTVSRPTQPLSGFDAIVASLPENEWAIANVNKFQDTWTPFGQYPTAGIGGSPRTIIEAWGSATWDSNRGEYIIWGGGHANYGGNEVHTWNSTTLEWERASLPSQIEQISGARYETVDGYEHSPISSHAYDNLEFLQVADRMINFGGAAAHTGGPFVETDGITPTGPYFWDPAKADPDKVGGLTGSHVDPDRFPDVTGGQMWENRQTWDDASPRPVAMVSGTTDYALIDGVDVVFVNDMAQKLYKYTVPDVNDAARDTWELVGTVGATYGGAGAGAYSPDHNIYVRTSGTSLIYWDLDYAGPTNRSIAFAPVDTSGEFSLHTNWGMEYDPVREQFVLWQGDAGIWLLDPPDVIGASGWTVSKAAAPTGDSPETPDLFRGVLGKWDYVASHDVFVGVNNAYTGDVWVYKPDGWVMPDAWTA